MRQHYGFDGAELPGDTLSQGPAWMQMSLHISPRCPVAEQSHFGGVTERAEWSMEELASA